jgi:hypothetical protein
MRRASATATAGFAILLAACHPAGPNYHTPAAPQAPAWHAEGPWRPSDPKDQIPKGAWWEIFRDAELNRLETTVLAANQDLVSASARLQQARALASVAISDFYPQAGVSPSFQRFRLSANRPSLGLKPAVRTVRWAGPASLSQSTWTTWRLTRLDRGDLALKVRVEGAGPSATGGGWTCRRRCAVGLRRGHLFITAARVPGGLRVLAPDERIADCGAWRNGSRGMRVVPSDRLWIDAATAGPVPASAVSRSPWSRSVYERFPLAIDGSGRVTGYSENVRRAGLPAELASDNGT